MVANVTIATRVFAGNIGKYSIKFSTNCFSSLKLLDPILPDSSRTNTMSILGEDTKKKIVSLRNIFSPFELIK